MTYIYTEQDYLAHHGVKGMKWGVRKEREWNSNYNEKQRNRDRFVYGKGGVRRINKTMNKYGVSVSGARSEEARRINSTRSAAHTAGNIGSLVGAIVGTYAGMKLVHNGRVPQHIGMIMTVGSARVASALGKHGARGAVMLSRGYSPGRYNR